MEQVTYRKPKADDIGKIVEVTDYEPECEERHWIKQRLIWLRLSDPWPYLACPIDGEIMDHVFDGDVENWEYARIEEDS